MDNMQYGNNGRLANCIFQPSSLVGFGALHNAVYQFPPNPPEKRAELFNRIVSSRQFVGCLNKTTKLPAHFRDLLSVILVGEAETGTLYGITEVEWNRNSER